MSKFISFARASSNYISIREIHYSIPNPDRTREF